MQMDPVYPRPRPPMGSFRGQMGHDMQGAPMQSSAAPMQQQQTMANMLRQQMPMQGSGSSLGAAPPMPSSDGAPNPMGNWLPDRSRQVNDMSPGGSAMGGAGPTSVQGGPMNPDGSMAGPASSQSQGMSYPGGPGMQVQQAMASTLRAAPPGMTPTANRPPPPIRQNSF